MMTQKQKEKNLTRSEVLSMTRALELKMRIEDKVNARNELRRDLIAKKKESMQRTLYIEETLRDGEVRTTTPRSLVRRRIVRRMHIAMQRQSNNFMICEWGCGDWFRGKRNPILSLLCYLLIFFILYGLLFSSSFFLQMFRCICSRQRANRSSVASMCEEDNRLRPRLSFETYRRILVVCTFLQCHQVRPEHGIDSRV